MNRNVNIELLSSTHCFDICIIGGGATGLGIAVDAASRGLRTVLLEKFDFAKGTSSRSTKLIHGGVRYLEQGNLKLVIDALRERGMLMKNAPHLVKKQAFIIPIFHWWQKIYYGLGLKIYDWLSGSLSIGDTKILTKKEVDTMLPMCNNKKLCGGILYYDGQFDDTRLAMHLALTASEYEACILNYFPVVSVLKDNGKVCGVTAIDSFTKISYTIHSKVVINAGGVFSDAIAQLDDVKHTSVIYPSQGIHLVFDRCFLQIDHAIMIPKTKDGRVLFAVPWLNHVIVGTTDTPLQHIDEEPKALKQEIDFILEHMTHYFDKKPKPEDIKSVFAGLRPLVKSKNKLTSAISRDHHIYLSATGLVNIIGGKWTTYRKMAEDVITFVEKKFHMDLGPCKTKDLKIFAYPNETIVEQPKLHPAFHYTKTDIIQAVKNEMAMTLEDIMARRTRMLFLDAKAALSVASVVAEIMANEMGKDQLWINQQVDEFYLLSKNYTYQ